MWCTIIVCIIIIVIIVIILVVRCTWGRINELINIIMGSILIAIVIMVIIIIIIIISRFPLRSSELFSANNKIPG